MKKVWHGMPICECPVCGFATVDEENMADHIKKTGHEAQKEVSEPVLTPEVEETKKEGSHGKSKK